MKFQILVQFDKRINFYDNSVIDKLIILYKKAKCIEGVRLKIIHLFFTSRLTNEIDQKAD